jgi:acyl-CoA synthetase (AMP-forming)/AMP-acid ligase II
VAGVAVSPITTTNHWCYSASTAFDRNIMTFASPFPHVDVPDTALFNYLFDSITDIDLHRVALVDARTADETSYRALINGVESFAANLSARGIGVGHVVGLLAPNSAAFAIAFHGILRAGATVTTVNVLSTIDEIAKQLDDSNARLLITVTALRERVEKAAARIGPSHAEVVVLDGEGFRPRAIDRRASEISVQSATHLACCRTARAPPAFRRASCSPTAI